MEAEFTAILEYDQKDIMRIEDFFTKSRGDSDKVISLANSMAKKITNAEKAFNRAEAAKVVMKTKAGENNAVADIFYARANELGYDSSKIPVSLPKAQTTKPADAKPVKADAPKSSPVPVSTEKPVITHEPKSDPASKLPSSEQFKSNKESRTIPGENGAGCPIKPIGSVDIAQGTCGIYGSADDSIYDNIGGVVEVWKLNNDQHVLIFTFGLMTKNGATLTSSEAETPSVQIGTDTLFIASDTNKYLFYGELVDYIKVEDMSALIDLYGNVLPGYTYKK